MREARHDIRHHLAAMSRFAQEKDLDGLCDYLSEYQQTLTDENQWKVCDYYGKLDGLLDRRKLRLRIYDTQATTAKLELKEKSGSYQRKRSLSLSRQQSCALAAGDASPLLMMDNPFAHELYNLFVNNVYRPTCIGQRVSLAISVLHTSNQKTTFALPSIVMCVRVCPHLGYLTSSLFVALCFRLGKH